MSPCPSLNSKPSSADSLMIDVREYFHQPPPSVLGCIFYSYLLFSWFRSSCSSPAANLCLSWALGGFILFLLPRICFNNYTLIYPSWVLNLALFFDSYSLSCKQAWNFRFPFKMSFPSPSFCDFFLFLQFLFREYLFSLHPFFHLCKFTICWRVSTRFTCYRSVFLQPNT